MKRAVKILLVACLLAMPVAGFADGGKQVRVSVIEGRWERGGAKEIQLYGVDNGTLVKIASSVLTPDNRFYLAFAPQYEGFYVIGTSALSPIDNYMFYFKPGDGLRVDVLDKSYRLVGENTPENLEMERWHEYMLPLESKSIYFAGSRSTYEDFFPVLEDKLAEGYVAKFKQNETFSNAFASYCEFDIALNALNLLMTPRSKHPRTEDFPEYYTNLDLAAMTQTGALLGYPYGMTLIKQYSSAMPRFNTTFSESEVQALRDPIRSIHVFIPMIANDTIRGEAILQRSAMVKTYEGFKNFENSFGHYLLTDSQKKRFRSLLKDIPIPETGPAIDFSFPDIDGKEVALSDFKGKVVYIDVWATWCGPCIGEIPSLKVLEKEYHGKDVVFMSVSTDKAADRQKWLDMVAEKELKGVQLHAGDKAREGILDPYKISGIPRFILVGKDGSIINVNAPRPSSSEIRPLLEAALAK